MGAPSGTNNTTSTAASQPETIFSHDENKNSNPLINTTNNPKPPTTLSYATIASIPSSISIPSTNTNSSAFTLISPTTLPSTSSSTSFSSIPSTISMDTTMDSGGSGTGGGSSGRKRDRSPSPSSDASTSSSRSVVGGGHTSAAAATPSIAVDLHAGLLPNKEAGTRSDSLPSKLPLPPLQENNTNAQTTTDEHVLQKEHKEHKEETIVYNQIVPAQMYWGKRKWLVDGHQLNFVSNIDPKFETFIDSWDSRVYVGWHPRTWPKDIQDELIDAALGPIGPPFRQQTIISFHPRMPLKWGVTRDKARFPFDPRYDGPEDAQMFQQVPKETTQGNK